MKFTIITVALNPGDKLQKTLDSVFRQTCTDYEIILKDGGSTDGSMDVWKNVSAERPAEAAKLCFFDEKDKGIYDAMNQAVAHAAGDYILFLNCGDILADEKVLERVAAAIDRLQDSSPLVLYGDTFSEKTEVVITSAPKITGFTCYRNIPCHQSCFYSAVLCREKPYDLQYKIRADYDHFLWCFYRAKARFCHLDFPVSSYEGGGYSENKANMQKDKQEHRQITKTYMSGAELFRSKVVMALTLAPLRRKMADSRIFSGVYHWVKKMIYRK